MAVGDQSERISPKETAELERLRLEIEALRRPAWRQPAVIIPAVGLVISLVANVQQWRTADRAAEQARQQLQHSQERWADERKKLVFEVEDLRDRLEERRAKRSSVNEELEKVNHEIAVYDDHLFKDMAKRKEIEVNILLAEQRGQTFIVEAQRKNLKVIDDSIAWRKNEKAQLEARRFELEKERN